MIKQQHLTQIQAFEAFIQAYYPFSNQIAQEQDLTLCELYPDAFDIWKAAQEQMMQTMNNQ